MSLFQETQIVYAAYLRCLYLPESLHAFPTPNCIQLPEHISWLGHEFNPSSAGADLSI